MKTLEAAALIRGCDEMSEEAGITIATTLEPLAGPGAPVKPAVYEGGRYQVDRRWWGDGEAREPVDVVSIDNVPSQANRLEAALARLATELRLPQVVLDLHAVGSLPPHLPRTLSGYQFPHRQADAYLRDALLEGQSFPKTEIGKALIDATADEAGPILEWFPQALLFGYWQSHLGKKRSQSKLARSWVSEIIGYAPAVSIDNPTTVLGVKGDRLNLSVDEQADFSEDDLLGREWHLIEGSTKGPKGSKKEKLSELGHGQVTFPGPNRPPALAGISFAEISQRATISFASLRRVRVGTPEQDAAARAVLVALGIAAHVNAFGRAFSLRSGCDLRPVATTWTWLGSQSDEEIPAPSIDEAVALFAEVVGRAEAVDLPVGERWPEPLVLEPNDSLTKAIRATWPLED